jgi:hypothetical protein
MKTNDLKKGTLICLGSGIQGFLDDNQRRQVRRIRVSSNCPDEGKLTDCYAHEIIEYRDVRGMWHNVELTAAQITLRDQVHKTLDDPEAPEINCQSHLGRYRQFDEIPGSVFYGRKMGGQPWIPQSVPEKNMVLIQHLESADELNDWIDPSDQTSAAGHVVDGVFHVLSERGLK